MKYFEFAFDQYRFCSDVNTEVTTFVAPTPVVILKYTR